MTQEDKSKFYKILISFSQGNQCTRFYLLHQHSKELVDEAIQKGYIEEDHKTEENDPVYVITTLGKEVWE